MKLRDLIRVLSSLTLVFAIAFSTTASEETNHKAISVLAEKIVELRTEVENLNTKNQARKAELQSELKSLQARKAQVNAQIQQIELSLKQSKERLATIKEEISKAGVDGDKITPLVVSEVSKVKEWVLTSLPFQKEKRLKEMQNIEEGLEAGTLSGQKALGKLWAFIEDELRLGRENGVHRQTLNIHGEEKLVSVAKLGMVAMFYKTADNKYGFSKKSQDGTFSFIAIQEKDQVERVAALFDGLKKQIRTGQYDIPNIF